MSFGSLGWRSGGGNPRLAGKSIGSSNRLSLAASSPVSRSLTHLPFGASSAVDQYITSAASSYTSTPNHRRNPHVRRTSQPSTASSRLRASSHTNLSSINPTQIYAVIQSFPLRYLIDVLLRESNLMDFLLPIDSLLYKFYPIANYSSVLLQCLINHFTELITLRLRGECFIVGILRQLPRLS